MSRKPAGGPTAADDFLNPASMLTPGLAGSLTMVITNALSAQFGFTPSWTGLIVSFLCGTLVFVSSVGPVKKLIYYVLNSLIIFSVAAGASGFAATATQNITRSIGISPAYAVGLSQADQNVAVHAVSAAHNMGTIGRAGHVSAFESRQVAQVQPEENSPLPADENAETTMEASPVVLEPAQRDPAEEAAKAQQNILEMELKAAREALAATEMQAEIARQEAERAKQEAENAKMEAVKPAKQSSSGFFKNWF